MRNIGYRIRLPTELKKQCEFISRYAYYFDTFEVKVKDNINYTSCIENIVMLAKNYLITVPSFHLVKDMLYNQVSMEKSKVFVSNLRKLAKDMPIILVTHYIPEKEYSRVLSENINNTNFTLAIENIEVTENLSKYLDDLKKSAMDLNAKVCLDLGHLLFSIFKCGENEPQILGMIANDIWWINNIVEFHLHDFDSQKCHLNIGKGNMNFELIAPFINTFSSIPIILETTIEDLSVQGVTEVKFVKEVLNKYDNM